MIPLQLETDRLQHPRVVIDVLPDLDRHLRGDALVAFARVLLGARLQVDDRDHAVDHQRRDRGGRNQQDESGSDARHCEAATGRHAQIVLITSRPASCGTSNRELTTRATFGHAMNIAGGSSWKIC